MFALHLVHGMHPEMFEEKVVFTLTTYGCIRQLFFVLTFLAPISFVQLITVVILSLNVTVIVRQPYILSQD